MNGRDETIEILYKAQKKLFDEIQVSKNISTELMTAVKRLRIAFDPSECKGKGRDIRIDKS